LVRGHAAVVAQMAAGPLTYPARLGHRPSGNQGHSVLGRCRMKACHTAVASACVPVRSWRSKRFAARRRSLLQNSSRLTISSTSRCALTFVCRVSQVVAKDVRPPISEPASAATAAMYVGSMKHLPPFPRRVRWLGEIQPSLRAAVLSPATTTCFKRGSILSRYILGDALESDERTRASCRSPEAIHRRPCGRQAGRSPKSPAWLPC
jgi:hypothetical protein